MKKLKWPALLAGLALTMAVSLNVKSAIAYFTTYVTASGGHPITYTITEPQPSESIEPGSGHKIVVAQNTGTVDCYVRVRAFAGNEFKLDYPAHDGWKDTGDGYWEYTEIVPAGGKTTELRIEITRPEGLEDDYDVTVVQECTPVTWQPDGTPNPPDWALGKEAAAE